MKHAWLLSAAAVIASPALAEGPFTIEFEEIAAGVWTGIRPDAPRPPVMGNTIFVISDEGVVVFDGGGVPAMADLVIDKIRSLTDRPVTHVVTSHWHGDHNFGIYRFGEEFQNVQFIAHEFTRDVFESERIHYIDRQQNVMAKNLDEFRTIVATGVDSEGKEYDETERAIYQRLIDDADVIDRESLRARITPPNLVMTDRYVIESGGRRIELLHLGHGNTKGDIVMWLPEEKIVATGDIVVLPSPYAFNVPPRPWADTLRRVKALDYEILVPGHGPVQRDTEYVDLLIETAVSVADERDRLLADGMSAEDVQAALDFASFEDKFTHGNEFVRVPFEKWFEQPFRAAAMKALTGEPMVDVSQPEFVPFDDERWTIEGDEKEQVEYLGQQALWLKGAAAVLRELDIPNGLVEFDVAVSKARGFAGLVFRLQDERNFEHFYIRPHQSGNPDANQYTPVFGGVSGWQLYYGADYAAPVQYRFDEWMHVKVIYAGSKAEIYIDSDEPVLRVNDLKRGDRDGAIGLNVSNYAGAHFANFRYARLADGFALPDSGPAAQEMAPGMIASWQVSDAFDEASIANLAVLGQKELSARRWTALEAEPSGVANLARVQGVVDGRNTVFACYDMVAERAGFRTLDFGYSDKARVYLNGKLIYSGDNTYMSRDYRYLGTIGLFDSVLLSLEPGRNEICIAVTEAFGGWGVTGRLSNVGQSP